MRLYQKKKIDFQVYHIFLLIKIKNIYISRNLKIMHTFWYVVNRIIQLKSIYNCKNIFQ